MSTVTAECPDLDADLAICEAATLGPWDYFEDNGAYRICDEENFDLVEVEFVEDMKFIAAARQGWPYAIRRAQEAERENDRLRDEINLLQEQLNQHHRSHCYD